MIIFSSSGHEQDLTKEPIIMAGSGCHLTNCPRVRKVENNKSKSGGRKVNRKAKVCNTKRNKRKVKVKSRENERLENEALRRGLALLVFCFF